MFGVKFTRIKTSLPIQGRHYHVSRWPGAYKEFKAVTLFPFVIHRDPNPSEKLIIHEEEHIQQILKRGGVKRIKKISWWAVLRWHLSYGVEFIKNGYQDNRYERKAREKSNKR